MSSGRRGCTWIIGSEGPTSEVASEILAPGARIKGGVELMLVAPAEGTVVTLINEDAVDTDSPSAVRNALDKSLAVP